MTLADEIKRIKKNQKYLIVVTSIIILSDVIIEVGKLILSIMQK